MTNNRMPSSVELSEEAKVALHSGHGQDDGSRGLIQAGQRTKVRTVVPPTNLQSGREVGRKLALAFGLLIATFAWNGLSGAGLHAAHVCPAWTSVSLTEAMLELQRSQDGLRYSSENGRIIAELFLVQQPEVIQQLLARRAENSRKISALIPLLASRNANRTEEKRLLENGERNQERLCGELPASFLRLLLTEKKRDDAAQVMVEQTTPALSRYHAAWDEFLRFQFDQVRDVSEQGKQQHINTRRIMLILDSIGGCAGHRHSFVVTTRKVSLIVTSRIRAQEEVYKLNTELEQRVSQRTQDLQHTEERLRGSLAELQGYTSRVEAVNQLVELLQSCLTLQEAHFSKHRASLAALLPGRSAVDAEPIAQFARCGGRLGKRFRPARTVFSGKLLGLA